MWHYQAWSGPHVGIWWHEWDRGFDLCHPSHLQIVLLLPLLQGFQVHKGKSKRKKKEEGRRKVFVPISKFVLLHPLSPLSLFLFDEVFP